MAVPSRVPGYQASPRIWPFALLLCAWLSAGCSESDPAMDWQLVRFGEPVGHKLVGLESREILATRAVLELQTPLEEGCLLEYAYASGRDDGTRTFRLTASSPDGREISLLDVAAEGQTPWMDQRHRVGEGGLASLRFEIEGPVLGAFWSRPLAHCSVPKRPVPATNVILVSLDTMRADRLGAYGNPSGLTPHLDRLAREGALFENVYATYPNTLSSHASLFTGLYPSQHGLLAGHMANIPDDAKTLARSFSDAGHQVVAFTENGYVASGFGFDTGFDRYHNGAELVRKGQFPGNATDTFGLALDWLDTRGDAPFFMFLHTYEVHAPYAPKKQILNRLRRERQIPAYGRFASRFESIWALSINRKKVSLDPRDWQQIELLYDAEVVGLDAEVGRLQDKLHALGLADHTLLVFVSDHGEEFDEHGFIGHGETIHRQALQVPVVFHKPGAFAAGRRVSQPVSLIDVGPTIAELAGLPAPFENAPAQSLAPLLRGESLVASRPVYSELEKTPAACGERAPGDSRLCPYGGVSIREGDFGFIHRAVTGVSRLYDYRNDPDEQRDVAAEHPDRVASFEARVREYLNLVSSESPSNATPASAEPLDPDVAEKLKALGYVE